MQAIHGMQGVLKKQALSFFDSVLPCAGQFGRDDRALRMEQSGNMVWPHKPQADTTGPVFSGEGAGT